VTDRLLTAREVAEFLAVPESWVREHTRSGSIPHFELGRYRRYRLDDVLTWLGDVADGQGPRFRRYHPNSVMAPARLTPPEARHRRSELRCGNTLTAVTPP
jgi:excisionase family DNA binding protein